MLLRSCDRITILKEIPKSAYDRKCLPSALMGQFRLIDKGRLLAHRNHQGVKMRQNSGTRKSHGVKVVTDIHRATRKQYSAEEKIRNVLDGLKGEDSIAELCHHEGIAQS